MSKISALREVACARKSGGTILAHGVVALESSTLTATTDAADLIKVALEFHVQAKLPPAVGVDVLDFLQDAASHAAKSRIATAMAHQRMRELAKTHGIEFMGPAQCDDDKRNF